MGGGHGTGVGGVRAATGVRWTESGVARGGPGYKLLEQTRWSTTSTRARRALMMNAAGAGPGYLMLQGESGVTRCLLTA